MNSTPKTSVNLRRLPKDNELNAKWQQSQYMHNMFSAHNETLDNDRYPGLVWSKLEECMRK